MAHLHLVRKQKEINLQNYMKLVILIYKCFNKWPFILNILALASETEEIETIQVLLGQTYFVNN